MAALALAGCKLVDQTTFGARPEAPAPDQLTLALADPGRIPLVVIRGDTPVSIFAEALDNAVISAEQRKPDVVFDLVSVVPKTGTDRQQEAAVAAAQQDALLVMDRMANAGADPANLRLAARVDPAMKTSELRIYVH